MYVYYDCIVCVNMLWQCMLYAVMPISPFAFKRRGRAERERGRAEREREREREIERERERERQRERGRGKEGGEREGKR